MKGSYRRETYGTGKGPPANHWKDVPIDDCIDYVDRMPKPAETRPVQMRECGGCGKSRPPGQFIQDGYVYGRCRSCRRKMTVHEGAGGRPEL